MKLLLLSAFCIVSVCVFAQNDGYPRSNTELLKKFKGSNNDSLQKQLQDYFKQKEISNNLLSNMRGNIAILPQDRMPCLVPDTKDIASMPNAWMEVAVPYKSPHHPIPNLTVPKPQSFKWNALDDHLKIPTK